MLKTLKSGEKDLRIRSKRNKERIKNKILSVPKKSIIKTGICIAVAVVLLVMAVKYIERKNIDSSYLARRETLHVGIRTDVDGFASYNESGEIEGFDKDIADEILLRVLGKEKPTEYVELTTEDSCSSLKYSLTDLGIGFLVDGSDRTEGWTNTKPYYYDDVYAVVSPGSSVYGVEDMDGKRIGILNSMITVAVAEDFVASSDIEAEIIRYYDYESANMDLNSGKVSAVLVPHGLINQYFSSQTKLTEPLFEIGYNIVLPTGQAAVESAINSAISSMIKDGTVENLAKKWGILY